MTDLTSKHVAILVDNYFEQVEYTDPKQVLKHAGAQVATISTEAETLYGMHGVTLGDQFIPDDVIANVNFNDYDMLVLPGGVINADKLRMNQTARDWVQHCIEHEKPIGAICHAPWLLVSAGVVSGLKLTSYYTLQDDIANAGGNWVDAELVIDGTIITSRTPKDLPAFCAALIENLERNET